mgnify:FL=1
MRKAFDRPIVGLFLDSWVVNSLKKQRYGIFFRLDLFFRAAERAGVTLFLFSIDGVSFNPDRVEGIIYNRPRQRWEPIAISRPDILYDRFVGRSPAQEKRADFIRRQFHRRGGLKINSRHYFDKMELYQILSRHPQLAHHLPYTRRLDSLADISHLFRFNKSIYLKAATGRRGQQVIRVTRLPNDEYAYSYFVNQLHSGKIKGLYRLPALIASVVGDRPVIVQQAVDLIQIDDRIVDFRGEMQRNGQGKLELVAVLARLGAKDSPVATHGTSLMAKDFFYKYLGYSREAVASLEKKIEDFLFQVYQCMEEAYGPFGEIAIDFGLDNKGRIWFFECNAKSMKVSLINGADQQVIQRAFLNPMLYAKYLYRHRENINKYHNR